MSLTKFTDATDNIQLLSDEPNITDGITAADLKLKFDQFGIDAKAYLNDVLTAEADATFATKAEVADVIAGQIPNGTITVDMLAFDPTEQPELDEHIADYVRNPGYGVSEGSLNAYTLTVDPIPEAYIDGMCFAFKVNASNTATSTLNVNSLGAKTILDTRGNVLTAGKLVLNTVATVRYNGTNFILQGEGSDVLTGNLTASRLLTGYSGYSNDPLTKIDGTMPNNGALNYTPSGVSQSVPVGYTTGGSVAAVTVPVGDVRSGVTIAGQTGTMDLTNKVAGNIKAGVTIDGTLGTLPDGTGKKGYATASVVANGSGSITVTGLNFTPSMIMCSDQSNGYRATYDVAGGANGYAIQNSGSSSPCTFSGIGAGTFAVTCSQFAGHSITYRAVE